MTKRENDETPMIFVVSDSTAETAEKISLAALAQFSDAETAFVRRRYVRTKEQIAEILLEAKEKKALIIFTFVAKHLRLKMREMAPKTGLFAVDLMGPILTALEHFLNREAQSEPGRIHRIDTEYFGRVEAVQFAVKHDDGQNLPGTDDADIVLVGPSRTAKTPLSIYLARFALKVSNIPLVLDLPIPNILNEIDQNRVIALIIDPHRLMEIRTARLTKLNQTQSDYAKIDIIIQELNYCRGIYRDHPKWGIIDVTGRAVEEVATDVRALIRKRNLLT